MCRIHLLPHYVYAGVMYNLKDFDGYKEVYEKLAKKLYPHWDTTRWDEDNYRNAIQDIDEFCFDENRDKFMVGIRVACIDNYSSEIVSLKEIERKARTVCPEGEISIWAIEKSE